MLTRQQASNYRAARRQDYERRTSLPGEKKSCCTALPAQPRGVGITFLSVACVTREIQVQPGMNLPVPVDPFWPNGHRRRYLRLVREGEGDHNYTCFIRLLLWIELFELNSNTLNKFSFIFIQMHFIQFIFYSHNNMHIF